jgi:ComF family protein
MLSTTLSLLGREAARIVLPASCLVCAAELPWRARVASCCAACWSSLPRITEPTCATCALPWNGDGESFVCGGCVDAPPAIDWAEAWGHYRGGLETLLHAFKFQRHDFLDDGLAGLLHERFVARGDDDFDAVVPVPMHPSKLRRRGYNQAELLARAFAVRGGLPFQPQLLRKSVERRSQSTLAKDERAANVRGAFTASAAANDRAVLLIDDIATTGQTLRACADALRVAGARRVATTTVARA